MLTGPPRGQEGGREAACWSYSSGLQDQVRDLMDRGQEGEGQTASYSYSSGLRDQVSDLMDRGQEGGRQTASYSYISRLQDQVSDLVDGGQERGGQTASYSYSSGLQDQVSDLLDGGQEGGGQHLSYKSGLQDQVSDLMNGGQEGGREAACWSSSSGLQDQVSDLMNGGQEGGLLSWLQDQVIGIMDGGTEDMKEKVNSLLALQFLLESAQITLPMHYMLLAYLHNTLKVKPKYIHEKILKQICFLRQIVGGQKAFLCFCPFNKLWIIKKLKSDTHVFAQTGGEKKTTFQSVKFSLPNCEGRGEGGGGKDPGSQGENFFYILFVTFFTKQL